MSIHKDDGFTLIELMVVVAIIGVLSAIAIPNFQKYQAKSKMSEAKLQLSAAYTAEQSFFGDYNIYAMCLKYMGYDPSNETTQRYYMVGFNTAALAPVDTIAVNSSVSLGLTATYGFGAGCQVGVQEPESNLQYFLPGRGIGSFILNYINFEDLTIFSDLGDQSDASSMTFTILAAGYISADNVTPTTASVLSINESKIIKVLRPGY